MSGEEEREIMELWRRYEESLLTHVFPSSVTEKPLRGLEKNVKQANDLPTQ